MSGTWSDYHTIDEAADFLGLSPQGVHIACWRGTLPAIKRAGALFIHIDDLRAYAARQDARARSGAAKRAKKAAREAARSAED